MTRTPFLSWNNNKNPMLGKLKLQSMERSNIFFEDWISFILLDGGIEDMSYGLFPKSPYTLNRNTAPKKVDVPMQTTRINGLFEDVIGKQKNKNMVYTVKVFVWVETDEEPNGVEFDFQQEEQEVKTATDNTTEND